MKKATSRRQVLFLFLSVITIGVSAQQKIKDGTVPGTTLPAPGSVLELESNSAGLRMPQIALTNTTTWAPLAGVGTAPSSVGMSIFNTNAAIASTSASYPANGVGEYSWDGTGWINKNSSITQNSLVLFSAKRSGSQATTQSVWVQIDFNAEDYDKNNNFNLTTNTFTVPANAAGFYQINALYSTASTGTAQGSYLGLFVNNVFKRYVTIGNAEIGAGIAATGTIAVQLVAGDVVDFRYNANTTGQVIGVIQLDMYQMSR
jgi:hypothetical protein